MYLNARGKSLQIPIHNSILYTFITKKSANQELNEFSSAGKFCPTLTKYKLHILTTNTILKMQ